MGRQAHVILPARVVGNEGAELEWIEHDVSIGGLAAEPRLDAVPDHPGHQFHLLGTLRLGVDDPCQPERLRVDCLGGHRRQRRAPSRTRCARTVCSESSTVYTAVVSSSVWGAVSPISRFVCNARTPVISRSSASSRIPAVRLLLIVVPGWFIKQTESSTARQPAAVMNLPVDDPAAFGSTNDATRR